MFFKKKKPESAGPGTPPPPWANIDETSKKKASTERVRLNIAQFLQEITGFSRRGTNIFILGCAIAIGFVAYIVYFTLHQPPTPPPDVSRPAMDARALPAKLPAPTGGIIQ
jgi:hypothetical protein